MNSTPKSLIKGAAPSTIAHALCAIAHLVAQAPKDRSSSHLAAAGARDCGPALLRAKLGTAGGERSDPIDWTLAFGRLGVPADLLLATRTAFLRATSQPL
jgi:hypothetical protein